MDIPRTIQPGIEGLSKADTIMTTATSLLHQVTHLSTQGFWGQ